MLLHMAVVGSFFLLCGIPLNEYTTMYVSILHLSILIVLMDNLYLINFGYYE